MPRKPTRSLPKAYPKPIPSLPERRWSVKGFISRPYWKEKTVGSAFRVLPLRQAKRVPAHRLGTYLAPVLQICPQPPPEHLFHAPKLKYVLGPSLAAYLAFPLAMPCCAVKLPRPTSPFKMSKRNPEPCQQYVKQSKSI